MFKNVSRVRLLMDKIAMEFKRIPSNYFLAMKSRGKIVAYSYSIERVLELSAAAGELAPFTTKASAYQGYPLYVGRVNIDGKVHEIIIDEKQKEGLLKLFVLE